MNDSSDVFYWCSLRDYASAKYVVEDTGKVHAAFIYIGHPPQAWYPTCTIIYAPDYEAWKNAMSIIGLTGDRKNRDPILNTEDYYLDFRANEMRNKR